MFVRPKVSERRGVMKYVWDRTNAAWDRRDDKAASKWNHLYSALDDLSDEGYHNIYKDCDEADI